MNPTVPAPVSPAAIAPLRRRGRGADRNPSGRFEKLLREDVDDGWGALETLPAFKTEVAKERPRSIIARNDSPDLAFDRGAHERAERTRDGFGGAGKAFSRSQRGGKDEGRNHQSALAFFR